MGQYSSFVTGRHVNNQSASNAKEQKILVIGCERLGPAERGRNASVKRVVRPRGSTGRHGKVEITVQGDRRQPTTKGQGEKGVSQREKIKKPCKRRDKTTAP